MQIIGSYNNLPLSILIRWGTHSKSSHLLFVFDETLVVQSSLTSGMSLAWFPKWKKHNELAWTITVPLPLEKEEEVYKALMGAYGDEGYDFKALAYWPYAWFLHVFFDRPMPTKNAWQNPNKKLCVGAFMGLPDWLTGIKPSEEEIEMTTPDGIGEIIGKKMFGEGYDIYEKR